jgi:lipoyl-dependent peroxiredoxin
MTTIYSTEATAIGGRSGSVSSIDGALRISLTRPFTLGGCGGPGTNPEQLFAAAHSASFLDAIRVAAEADGIRLAADSNVSAKVKLVADSAGAWQLEVILVPDLPELEEALLIQLLSSAALRCPYTIALKRHAKLSIRPL